MSGISLAQEQETFMPGDRVKLLKAVHPEVRFGTVSVHPCPGPAQAALVCVKFPSGFWGMYDPERLAKVSDAEWNHD